MGFDLDQKNSFSLKTISFKWHLIEGLSWNDFVKIAWREDLFRLNGNSDTAFGGHPFCRNWFLLSAISLK